ncbi:hypothetical protein INE66_004562 [Salmonella enterica subsp. enterica]|nr:hypothetical protein [Salmonella enterica subsp. enterica]
MVIIVGSGILTAFLFGFLVTVFCHSAADAPAVEPWEMEAERREAIIRANQPPKAIHPWLSEHSTDVGMIGIALAIIVIAGCVI